MVLFFSRARAIFAMRCMESDSTPRSMVPPSRASAGHSHPTLVLICFAIVYIVWGSTFYAIRVGIESFPPYLLAGHPASSCRACFLSHISHPKQREAHPLSVEDHFHLPAVLLFAVGNGTVSWAEKRVPSGIAALLVATVSLWMVLVDWLRPGGARPAATRDRRFYPGILREWLCWSAPRIWAIPSRIDPIGSFALIAASLAWAIGSIYSRHHPLPRTPLLACGNADSVRRRAALCVCLRGVERLGTSTSPM